MSDPRPWALLDDAILDVDADARTADATRRRRLLVETPPVAAPPSHARSAARYRCSKGLATSINTALATGLPLLITGRPGTGKSQVAWFIAHAFGLEPPISLHVRSTTTHRDFLYEFDAVAYLHAAYMARHEGAPLVRGDFVRPGPFWQAVCADGPRVLLVDEIDKAPRDFPNDLLHVLGEGWFQVPELGRGEADQPLPPHLAGAIPGPDGLWEVRRRKTARPIIVITSNNERRLPEPFLRRCVFHGIQLTPPHVADVVQAHAADRPPMDPEIIDRAIEIFFVLERHPDLRKPPTLAEFLVWLSVLAGSGAELGDLAPAHADLLPRLEVLIKSAADLETLRTVRLG